MTFIKQLHFKLEEKKKLLLKIQRKIHGTIGSRTIDQIWNIRKTSFRV